MFITPNPDYVTLQDLAVYLRKWHDAKYGTNPASLRVTETLLKANEEVGELNEAFRTWISAPTGHPRIAELERAVAEEAADVVTVLFHLIRKMGMALEVTILRKLQVIWDRLHEPAMSQGLEPTGVGLPGGESALNPSWYDPPWAIQVHTEQGLAPNQWRPSASDQETASLADDFRRDEE